tara:strand:+ start:770 stop:1006 length:237 start_codon:yes stop_codon:yes gene_type:complete
MSKTKLERRVAMLKQKLDKAMDIIIAVSDDDGEFYPEKLDAKDIQQMKDYVCRAWCDSALIYYEDGESMEPRRFPNAD